MIFQYSTPILLRFYSDFRRFLSENYLGPNDAEMTRKTIWVPRPTYLFLKVLKNLGACSRDRLHVVSTRASPTSTFKIKQLFRDAHRNAHRQAPGGGASSGGGGPQETRVRVEGPLPALWLPCVRRRRFCCGSRRAAAGGVVAAARCPTRGAAHARPRHEHHHVRVAGPGVLRPDRPRVLVQPPACALLSESDCQTVMAPRATENSILW